MPTEEEFVRVYAVIFPTVLPIYAKAVYASLVKSNNPQTNATIGDICKDVLRREYDEK